MRSASVVERARIRSTHRSGGKERTMSGRLGSRRGELGRDNGPGRQRPRLRMIDVGFGAG
jgi:hypothetical protein